VILYRCLAWNERGAPDKPDGALWFPRVFQGEGRHDNPDVYGCLYLSEAPLSCIVEQLARFRGQRLTASLLRRRSLPLALAELELEDDAELVDLDEPAVLRRERLRPSRVATRQRDVTRPQARALHERHPAAAGLRWWSTFESLWANVTLFDRAASALRLSSVRVLDLADEEILSAADVLGLRVG
jgi:RES domain